MILRMKKMICILCLFVTCLSVQGQSQVPMQKQGRHPAATDAPAVSARKISARFTDGLKAYYSGNSQEALKIFDGILLDNPKHDASYFMLSKIYADREMLPEAADALRHALVLDKENIWYKVDLATLYMDMAEYSGAAKLWEQICKVKSNNEYYLYALSEAYLNLKKYGRVIDTYDRMEQIIGHNDELTKNKASLWLYMDKVSEAVNEYDKLIAIYPYNADYYIQAGDICQSNGRPEQAMAYYARAIEINPDDPELSITLAAYWEQKGDSAMQMRYMLRYFRNPAADLSGKIPYMRNILQNAINSGDEENIRNLEPLALALMQTHPQAGEGYAFHAGIRLLLKQYEAAKDDFEEAFKRDKTSFSTWEDYCYVLEQLNQMAEILKYEKDIVELFPNNAFLLFSLGRAHLANGEAGEALFYLKRALENTYESTRAALIYEATGDAYNLKGEHDKARDYWEKARKKGRNSPALMKKLAE